MTINSFEYSMDTIANNVDLEPAKTFNFSAMLSLGDTSIDIPPKNIIGCTTPACNIEMVAVNYTGAPIEIPGTATFEPVTLSVMENSKGDIYQKIFKWFNKTLQIDDGTIVTHKFKDIFTNKTLTINQLNSQGKEVLEYRMDGVYLDGTPSVNYSYEDSSIIKYDVIIKYLSFTINKK